MTIPYPYIDDIIIQNALQKQPEEENPLQLNEFRFVLHRTPHIIYFCQAVNLPSLTIGEIQQPTMFGRKVRRTGTSIDYASLTVSFIVNENMSNWMEIRNWMKILINEKDFEEHTPNERNKFSDGSLILMNSKSKPFIRITYQDMFPLELGGMDFDSKVTDISPAISTVTFAYTGFEIEYLGAP